MMGSYGFQLLALMLVLLLGMLSLAFLGHRHGRSRNETDKGKTHGTGVVDAALFALLGLLIAFTFATAYSRFNMRRDLVVQEANAIGTAYLRLDLLPAEAQPSLREKFKGYVDSRIAFWLKLSDPAAAWAELSKASSLQNEIWFESVKATENSQSARMLLLPALNEMIDITTTRLNAIMAHPPRLLFVVLFVLALVCAWLTGYAMAEAATLNWLHVILYGVIVTLMIYVIIDLEYPRYGLIRLDLTQELLAGVRANMN
jgi:hypothetical protein